MQTFHRFSFKNRWINRENQSKHRKTIATILQIHAEWLRRLIIYDWICKQQRDFCNNWIIIFFRQQEISFSHEFLVKFYLVCYNKKTTFDRQSEKYHRNDAKHSQLRTKQRRNDSKTHDRSNQQTSKNDKIRRKRLRFFKSTKHQDRKIIRQVWWQKVEFVQNVATHEQCLSIWIIWNHANSRCVSLLIFAQRFSRFSRKSNQWIFWFDHNQRKFQIKNERYFEISLLLQLFSISC